MALLDTEITFDNEPLEPEPLTPRAQTLLRMINAFGPRASPHERVDAAQALDDYYHAGYSAREIWRDWSSRRCGIMDKRK